MARKLKNKFVIWLNCEDDDHGDNFFYVILMQVGRHSSKVLESRLRYTVRA